MLGNLPFGGLGRFGTGDRPQRRVAARERVVFDPAFGSLILLETLKQRHPQGRAVYLIGADHPRDHDLETPAGGSRYLLNLFGRPLSRRGGHQPARPLYGTQGALSPAADRHRRRAPVSGGARNHAGGPRLGRTLDARGHLGAPDRAERAGARGAHDVDDRRDHGGHGDRRTPSMPIPPMRCRPSRIGWTPWWCIRNICRPQRRGRGLDHDSGEHGHGGEPCPWIGWKPARGATPIPSSGAELDERGGARRPISRPNKSTP